MNIHAEKIELAKLLLATNDKGILEKIKTLLKRESVQDWWDKISPAEREAIEIGLKQAENGETVPHSEAVKQFAKWGLK